ncbi:hypothetical protein EYF80_026733 [Liparis tanakae]|uniref:Uncharacterized protein n=1 Tax=Liparis tanakae TaxID=230148 RepID=A0A4Z2HB40_9TELE|nr:hypothetical protein EYF80_026733 [Liparis tanakae]
MRDFKVLRRRRRRRRPLRGIISRGPEAFCGAAAPRPRGPEAPRPRGLISHTNGEFMMDASRSMGIRTGTRWIKFNDI